jgi:hypothetical protein
MSAGAPRPLTLLSRLALLLQCSGGSPPPKPPGTKSDRPRLTCRPLEGEEEEVLSNACKMAPALPKSKRTYSSKRTHSSETTPSSKRTCFAEVCLHGRLAAASVKRDLTMSKETCFAEVCLHGQLGTAALVKLLHTSLERAHGAEDLAHRVHRKGGISLVHKG